MELTNMEILIEELEKLARDNYVGDTKDLFNLLASRLKNRMEQEEAKEEKISHQLRMKEFSPRKKNGKL
jgi:hypothetical protein